MSRCHGWLGERICPSCCTKDVSDECCYRADLSQYSDAFKRKLTSTLRQQDKTLLSLSGTFDVMDVNTDGETPLLVALPKFVTQITKHEPRTIARPMNRKGGIIRKPGTKSTKRGSWANELKERREAEWRRVCEESARARRERERARENAVDSSPVGPTRRRRVKSRAAI